MMVHPRAAKNQHGGRLDLPEEKSLHPPQSYKSAFQLLRAMISCASSACECDNSERNATALGGQWQPLSEFVA